MLKLSIMINSVLLKLLSILIFFISLFPLYSQIADNYPPRSDEIAALDKFFLELGETPPFYSRPFSNHQYFYYLEQIESRQHNLSPSSKRLFSKLLEKHRWMSEKETFLLPVLEASAELKYQNREIPDSHKYLYYRESLDSPPLLNTGFIAGSPHAAVHLEYDLRKDFFVYSRQKDYSNLPTGDPFVQDFDFNFPTRSYLKVGNLHLDLLIGREQIKWGPGYRSSLVVSDSPPYYDMLLFSYFSESFKASFFFTALESYLTKEELKIQQDMTDIGTISFEKEASDQYKALTGHRFEFKFHDTLLIGVSDVLLFGGRAPELNEISPLIFLHNVYGENYSNVMMGFDASYVPVHNVRIYGELAIDDIRNSWEAGSSIPTTTGKMAGLQVMNTPLPGSPDFYYEWARLDPWMYNRWQPYLIFSSRRKLVSFPDSTKYASYLDFPTGYFLGGDVQTFYFELAWSHNPQLNTSLSYEFRQKGEIYLNVLDPASKYENYKENTEATPTGTPIVSHIVKAKGKFQISPRVTLSGNITTGYRQNREHEAGQNGFFFETTLNGAIKFY